jgi:GH3 auxin-responsive promoter
VICGIANTLWLAGCLPEAVRFRLATARVREEQEQLLRRLLRENADTEFGRRHGLSAIRSAGEYQQRVSLTTYDELRPLVDRVAEGVPNVLTRQPVHLMEPTSGSAGPTKLVPYTAALQQEFQRGIRPWIADLFVRHPRLANGQAYWSVSPVAASARRTPGGIPIGFEDDASYVGGWQQRLVRAVMAVPADIRRVSDMDAFRYLTLLALVRAANLRLVSVWHPTFLVLLVDRLPEWGDALARELATDPRRRDVLRAALRATTPGERHAILWPHLGLISCWTDGHAAASAASLASLFPHARLQGKGLIATEGFVSFPLTGRDGAAIAIRSHFFEFVPVDALGASSDDAPRLAHELERGQRYAVVLTTGGGLYRYQLQDVIDVVGHVRQCPLIRFVGRQGHVSDWFGEKLNEAHVTGVLHEVFESLRVSPEFAMLACDETLPSPAYVLYIETTASDELLRRLGDRIDLDLHANFHYGHARRLGQLAPLRVFRARGAGETYLSVLGRSEQRLGDVKPVALDRRGGWSQILRGQFVAASTSGM